MDAIEVIWDEDVYRNKFRCQKCGNPMLSPKKRLQNIIISSDVVEASILCANCRTKVADIEPPASKEALEFLINSTPEFGGEKKEPAMV